MVKKKHLKNVLIATLTMPFLLPTTTLLAETDASPTGITVIGEKGANRYTRKVATAIGVYVKKGTVPGMRKFSGSWGGVKYNALEIDGTGKNGTFIQVDYAGHDTTDDKPKYLNNFYDKQLTANSEYYWVGAINAGFFTNNSGSNMYGYPTGAVKKDGVEEQYRFTDGSDTWNTSPSYGTGFSTAHLNKDGDFKLLYNGWKSGKFYKYNADSAPNTWDYGDYANFEDAVSGAYTLIVDGNSSVHWGKSDGSYWDYPGTCVTLFGQKADGNYILLTTEGRISSNQEVALMSSLGCANAIRFDGGGSTQMAFDKGMSLDHYYFTKTTKDVVQGQPLDTSDIAFDLYMSDNSYHWASIADAPQVDVSVFNSTGEPVTDLSKAPVGQYRLRVMLNGLEQAIDFNVIEAQQDITVKFENHLGEVIHTAVIKNGEVASCPIDMVREGYTFDGWDIDLATITQDTTVKPKYSAINYDLTFNLDGGIADNPANYTIEDEIVLKAPTKEGYTFVGWTSNENPEKQMEVTIPKGTTGNKTYTANYEITTYNLTYRFDMENVTNDNPTMYTINDKITLNLPEARGYNFVGWYLDGNPFPEGVIEAGSTGDKELYGEFDYITYKAEFDDPNVSPIEFNISDLPVQLPIPTKENNTFGGWYESAEFAGEAIQQLTDIGSKTLYAKWIPTQSKLQSMEVANKVETFTVGETPNSTMFTVTGHYEDGSTAELFDYTIEPNTPLVLGENVLTFTSGDIVVQHTVTAIESSTPEGQEGNRIIDLTAKKASSYTVTLPKTVDITNDMSSFDVKVQGDISGDEKITISVADTALKELDNESNVVPVTVMLGDGKSKAFAFTDITNENIIKVTLTHDTLSSGQWIGELKVNIGLETTK